MSQKLLDRIAAVEAENDELREVIRQKDDIIASLTAKDTLAGLWKLGLTPSEEIILRRLVAGGRVRKAALLDALSGESGFKEAPEIKIIDVFICKIRRKLDPWDVIILTHWGQGYELTPPERAKLLAVIVGMEGSAG